MLVGTTELNGQARDRQSVVTESFQRTEKYSASDYKLPVSFEPNLGQFNDRVRFAGRGLGYGFFLTNDEAVMVFSKPLESGKKNDKSDLSKKPRQLSSSALRMKFVGANPWSEVSPREQLTGERHYLSSDRSITNVPEFKSVVYDNLYQGIDLKFYSNEQLLEYDFVVDPKTDISKIRLSFQGAKSIRIAPNGDLVLLIDGEEIRHKKKFRRLSKT